MTVIKEYVARFAAKRALGRWNQVATACARGGDVLDASDSAFESILAELRRCMVYSRTFPKGWKDIGDSLADIFTSLYALMWAAKAQVLAPDVDEFNSLQARVDTTEGEMTERYVASGGCASDILSMKKKDLLDGIR